MVVAIASDHAGFALKQALKPVLEALGHTVQDLGVDAEQPADYPDQAWAVAQAVTSAAAAWGVVVDGAGVGSSIAANKVPGIRAALCNEIATARNARLHNDANVLVLGSRVIGSAVAEEVVRVFAGTAFEGGRHQRRLDKITEIERRYLKITRETIATVVRQVLEALTATGLVKRAEPAQSPAEPAPPAAAPPAPTPPPPVPQPPAAFTKRFLTVEDVRQLLPADAAAFQLPAGVRLTPLAADYLRQRRITLLR